MLYQHPAKCFTQNCPNIDQKFETRICDVQILMPAPVLLKYIITFTLAFWGQICQLVSLWILFVCLLVCFPTERQKGVRSRREKKWTGTEKNRGNGNSSRYIGWEKKSSSFWIDSLLCFLDSVFEYFIEYFASMYIKVLKVSTMTWAYFRLSN